MIGVIVYTIKTRGMKKLRLLILVFGAFIITMNLNAQQVELDGPRVGVTYITGDIAQRLADKLDTQPLITQFGWQFETEFFHLMG